MRRSHYQHNHHPGRRTRTMDDPFEESKCGRLCLRLACKIPVLIVLTIIFGDVYIAFGYSRVILLDKIGVFFTSLLLFLFGVAVTILTISYFRCMMTSSAVKDNPPPVGMDVAEVPRCEKCNELKPPRTHHCSICGTCTLKMDHHCPWVGNCVGLKNYKFFLVFLLWVSVAGTLYGIPTGIALWQGYSAFGAGVAVWAVLSIFISVSFAISVGGFFFFHVHLLSENKTTLENLNERRTHMRENPYNLKSNEENFTDIFGDNKWLWFLPVVANYETGYESYEVLHDMAQRDAEMQQHGLERKPFITTNVSAQDSQSKIVIDTPTEIAMQTQMRSGTQSVASMGSMASSIAGGTGSGSASGSGAEVRLVETEQEEKRRDGVDVNAMIQKREFKNKALRNMRIEVVDDDAVFRKAGVAPAPRVVQSANGVDAAMDANVGKQLYARVKGDSMARDERYRNMDN